MRKGRKTQANTHSLGMPEYRATRRQSVTTAMHKGFVLTPIASLLCAFAVQANTDEPSDAERAAAPIERIQIIGETRNEALSPQGAKLRGVFGLDEGILDIGRSITPLSEALLLDSQIVDLNSLSRLVPNTHGAVGFGSASLPTIRGQLGEVFSNGLRRQGGNNGFGIPMSFNSVEQLDVVKGMPPVMLGTTQRVGGFVNIQSKRPSLTENFSRIDLSASRWDRYGMQADVARVVSEDELAVRLSVELRDENSFYDYTHFNSENIFLAARMRPSDQAEWNVSWEYFDADFTDNAGLNRPTQGLIDHGLYITGQGQQPNGSFVPGAGAVVSPTGVVKIPRSQVLTDPDNISTGSTHILHSTFNYDVSDALTVVNRSYAEYLQRENIAQNSFVEIIDAAKTVENRIELHYQQSERATLISGASVRYNSVLGYSQFTTEADNPIDLTGSIDDRRIPLTPEQQARFVQLRPGLYVSPGANYDINNDGNLDFNTSDTTDSQTWQYGLFAQYQFQASDRLRLTTGVRGDWYDVSARDPLPPEGVVAAQDSYNTFLSAGEITALYQVTNTMNAYVTAAYAESTANSMGGGTVLGANNEIDALNFATENELYEVGLKWNSLDSSWYGDVAAFQQTRSLRNRDGSNSGIKTRGVEGQLYYMADTWLWNIGAAYLDARFDNSTAFQGTRQVADVFDNSRPDLIEGTGVGSPNFTAFPNSTARIQGLPRVSLSSSLRYELNERLRVGVDGWYTQAYPLDYLATVYIRDQYELNAMASYQVNENTQLRLDIMNLTDEKNWSPVFEGGYFGADLVMPNLPRHMKLTLSLRF